MQQPDSLDGSNNETAPTDSAPGNESGTEAEQNAQPLQEPARNPFDTVQPESRNEDTTTTDTSRRRRRDREAVQPPTTPDSGRIVGAAASEPASRERGSEPATETAPASGLYRVQIGVYSTREAAEQEARRLSDRGISTSVQAMTAGGRTLYRVQHGAFRNRVNAEAARERLKSSGVDSMVTQSK